MDLNTFVTETLKSIIDGVVEAQEYAASKGAAINAASELRGDNGGTPIFRYYDGEILRHSQMVDFDVAVSADKRAQVNAGFTVVVVPFGGGAKAENEQSQSSASRIKFSIPLYLPIQLGTKQPPKLVARSH